MGFESIAQEFNFNIHNTSLEKYIQLEKGLMSEEIPNRSRHVSFSGNAQPISFLRLEKIIPDMVARYFFKEKDSTMSYIEYEWDDNKSGNKIDTLDIKSREYQRALINRYLEVYETVTNKYGASVSEGDLSDLKKTDTKEGLKRKDIWHPNDTTEIEMYINLSNYHEKLETTTRMPTHRIRMYVRNTKKNIPDVPKLDDKRVHILDSEFQKFLFTLGIKNFNEVREFLSDLIKLQVTDDQLTALMEAIHFDRDTEIFFSGVQMGLNGDLFTTLDYKYTDDNSRPPNEIIKVIFDGDDKIVGIQPVTLQNETED